MTIDNTLGSRSVLGLLAIECAEPGAPPRCIADRTHAGALANAIAGDLAKLAPEVSTLDLVTVAALFDQAQLLRPGWPVHATLLALHGRIAAHGQSVGLLALGEHDGAMPNPLLQPEPALFGSPLLILPWLLHGDAHVAQAISGQFERELLDRGMGGSELALAVQDAFGVQLRHVQHVTVFDLCALACAQYGHAGFAPLWQLIENALLTPDRQQAALVDDLPWTYSDQRIIAPRGADPSTLAHHRAILAAHGITVAVTGG